MEQSIARKAPLPTAELLSFIAEIVAKSSDSSCYMAEREMAKRLHIRKSTLRAAKAELINSGQLILSLRRNGNRKNPKHRLTLPDLPRTQPAPTPQPTPEDAMYRVPDLLPLMAFNIWPELDRLTLIDCYLRSQWNVCPLQPLSKIPQFSKRRWAKLSRSEKIDIFYAEPDYG